MAKATKRCAHRHLKVLTEKDRCSWVVCQGCRKKGPKKHSVLLALVAFAVCIADQHPRKKK
jgi:hypothetical protein